MTNGILDDRLQKETWHLYVEQVIGPATRIENVLEGLLVEEALTGTPLREARIKYGYHQLQRSNG